MTIATVKVGWFDQVDKAEYGKQAHVPECCGNSG